MPMFVRPQNCSFPLGDADLHLYTVTRDHPMPHAKRNVDRAWPDSAAGGSCSLYFTVIRPFAVSPPENGEKAEIAPSPGGLQTLILYMVMCANPSPHA